jgi:hypothetical protein
MSAATLVAPPAPAATRRDTRTLRRVGAAVLMPLGPLAVAILRAVLPYFHARDNKEAISQTAAHLGREDAVLWLSVVAMIALVPSALSAGRLAQRRAPVLSLLGVCLLVPAYSMLFLFTGEPTLRALATGPVTPDTAAKLLDTLNNLAQVSVAGALFVPGHILGMIFIGAALWRAHAVPVWAAIALIVSQPLHLIFFVVLGSQPLDACAWGLTAIGLGVAAIRVLRTPNDAWDLPPALNYGTATTNTNIEHKNKERS